MAGNGSWMRIAVDLTSFADRTTLGRRQTGNYRPEADIPMA